MSNTAIQKINSFGKAGNIIANICKVLVIIAIVAVILATIVMFALPKDLVQIRVDAHADVAVDYSLLGIDREQVETDEVKEALEEIQADGNLSINGLEFALDGLSFEDGSILIGANGEVSDFDMGMIRFVLIFALVGLVLLAVIMHFVCAFTKALSQCQTPFEESVIRKMRNLGWAMLCMPLVSSFVNSVSTSITTGRLSLGLNIDMIEVILILAVFMLTYVFKYGAVLQQESDETL